MTEPEITVTRWWLVRHAPPVNPERLIYGQSDIPVDVGETAAFAGLAAMLPAEADWVVTHLLRTRQTAEAIHAARGGGAPAMPPAMLEEPALAEQHFGEWQGMTREALNARRPGEVHRFWLAPATETPPGGESFADVVARVRGALGRLTAAHAGRDVVAVAHGGSIRAALTVALDLDPEVALRFRIDTLSLTRIDHIAFPGQPPAWRVDAVNLPPGAVPRAL